MNVLLAGLLISVFAFAVHLTLWKIRVPRHQTRALFVIFFVSAFLVFLKGQSLAWSEAAYAFFLVVCVGFCYATFYTAVEGSSPSLDIMLMLLDARRGMSRGELLDAMTDEALVLARLDDLVRCGMVIDRDGRYLLAPSGAAFISIFIRFRSWIKAGKGG